MATNGKPTTSFYVNYGNLTPTVAQRTLAPVLIAPRYALHRIDGNYGDTFVTSFPVAASDAVFPWPGKADGSIVDVDNVHVYAKNAWWKYNTASLSGTVTGVNCVTLAESIQLVTNEAGDAVLAAELQGIEVLPGDKVRIATVVEDGTQNVIDARVVAVEPALSEPSAIITPTKADISEAGIVVAVGEFKATNDVSYLVTVNSIDAEGKTATVEVLSLLGDAGYFAVLDINVDAPINLGELGLTIQLGSGAKSGDSYVVSVSPAKAESYNKIYVSADLEDYFNSESPQAVTVDFAADRILVNSTEIQSSAAWDIHASGLSFASNIKHTIQDSSRSLSLELYSADMHVAYRELLTDDLLELRTNQTGDISSWVGPVDPDNPMGMMYAACSATTGAFFYLLATDNSVNNTIKAVDYVAQFEAVYSFVPYLQTPEIQRAVIAEITKYSSPKIAQFKHAWFFTDDSTSSVVYKQDSAGAALIGSIDNDGVLSLIGSNVDVIGGGVAAGDVVEISRGVKGVAEYVVDRIRSKNEVVLRNAEMSGVASVQFRRTISSSDYAEKLADFARRLNNRCINFVVSDSISFGGFDNVSKAYLCAALAGMRSALAPHAPMNELVVPGFSVHDNLKWTDADYDVMNAGGCWVVAPNAEGNVVTYHQITTLTDGTIAEEDSVVSNGDEIVRRLRLAVRPYASGKSNVSDALIAEIRKVLIAELTQLQADYYPEIYGQRILGYTIEQLYIPEGNKSSIVCSLRLSLPHPMQDGVFNFNLF